MLTAGDIQYEPPSQKMFQVTRSITSMMSGDAVFYTEIMDSVYADLNLMDDDVKAQMTVPQVVQLFLKKRNSAKTKRAESSILGPLGLDLNKFRCARN
jgi:hypothetical protein